MIFFLLFCVITVSTVFGDHSYLPPKQPVSTTASPPYPPSGWKPSGRLLELPVRQQKQPQGSYGPPPPPPKPITTFTTQEIEEPTTTYVQDQTPPPKFETESETVNKVSGQLQASDSGIYYVLLPDGRLQRVTYTTMPLQDSLERLQEATQKGQVKPASSFVANVKYQDVEPITGPIYAYSSAPLVRIY